MTDPTRTHVQTEHSPTGFNTMCPTRLDAQLDGLSNYVGQNSVGLVGGGAASKSLLTATLKNTFFDFLAQNSATAGGIWRAGV